MEPAGFVKEATVVPHHSEMMHELKDVYQSLINYRGEVTDLKARLPDIVKNAIEEKATESGHVTASFVLERVTDEITKATDTMESKIITAIGKATFHLRSNAASATGSVISDITSPAVVPRPRERGYHQLYQSYKYHDKNAKKRNKNRADWDVPVDFDFPTGDLYVGWTAWLLGYPLNRSKKSDGEVYLAPGKPLHLLRYGHLSANIKKKFDNHWRPILELMHQEVDAAIRSTPVEKRNDGFIRSSYDLALKNVCHKYPGIAAALSGGRAISTCSKAIRASITKKRKAALNRY